MRDALLMKPAELFTSPTEGKLLYRKWSRKEEDAFAPSSPLYPRIAAQKGKVASSSSSSSIEKRSSAKRAKVALFLIRQQRRENPPFLLFC